MPTTPEGSDGPADSTLDAETAEALRLAARETVPVDRNHVTRPITVRPATPESREPESRQPESRQPESGQPESRETVPLDHETLGRYETVKIPGPRRPAVVRHGRAPLVVAAGFATLWAALISYLPVAAVIGLARTLEGEGGLGGAAHAGLAGWLLGHGVAIGTSIGPLALAPLLLTALVIWRLNRAGLHVTRAIGARRSRSVRAALLVAGTVGLWYALFGALAALAVDGRGTEVSWGQAGLNFFVLGALGASLGSLRSTNALAVLARKMPKPLRHGLRTGVVAALLILAAGTAATGLSVAIGGGSAADMIAAYRTGVGGQAGITLVSLAYGANAAVWAAAFLLGPGFTLGAGTAVTLTEVTLGPLPTLPLLAGLPAGPLGAAGATLLAVPVLAGMSAGWLMTRRMRRPRPARPGEPAPQPRTPSWSLVVTSALLAGPAAGLVMAILAEASGGALGDGRLSTIGPDPVTVGLVATAVVAVSATIGAAAARAFRTPPA
jgi:hypothetical protein